MYKKWIQKNPFFYFIKFKIIKSIFKENNKKYGFICRNF